jgi:hypothetical protein
MTERLTNRLGQFRKGPNCSPEELHGFTFAEIDGVKVLDRASNSTVTFIHNDGPALEFGLTRAMAYSQRSQQRLGHTVSLAVLRQKFPAIDKYCDDDQVQVIACSEAGKINPHKHAIHIISERLQMSPATIDRYFRIPTSKKTEYRTKAKKRRKL